MPQTTSDYEDPRPATLGDLDALLALQSLCHDAVVWSEDDYRGVLGEDGALRCAVAELQGSVCGFVVCQPAGAEVEIANLASTRNIAAGVWTAPCWPTSAASTRGDCTSRFAKPMEAPSAFTARWGSPRLRRGKTTIAIRGEAAVLLKREAPGPQPDEASGRGRYVE